MYKIVHLIIAQKMQAKYYCSLYLLCTIGFCRRRLNAVAITIFNNLKLVHEFSEFLGFSHLAVFYNG
jgi:hypothetical protein